MGVIAVLAILAYKVGEYLKDCETGRYFRHRAAQSKPSMELLAVRTYD